MPGPSLPDATGSGNEEHLYEESDNESLKGNTCGQKATKDSKQ